MSTYLHKFQNEDGLYDYLVSGCSNPSVAASIVPNHRVDFTQSISEEQEFTFEALTDGSIYWKINKSEGLPKAIEYKKNDGAWTQVSSTFAGSGTLITSVVSGDIVMFRGNNRNYGDLINGVICFSSFRLSKGLKCLVYGNLYSLLDSTGFTSVDSFESGYTFTGLMGGCAGFRTVNTKKIYMLATGLTEYCYQGMFANTRIKDAPYLPAKTLVSGCYKQMFQGCRKLNDKIELPATTLAFESYGPCLTDALN